MSRVYSKYYAQKTEIDGITFDSKAEGELYCLLKSTHSYIYCQPKIYLTDAKILYKPDFFTNNAYYEMKGFETPSWRIKKRLWKYYGPGELHIFKMVNHLPTLVETIQPPPLRKESDK